MSRAMTRHSTRPLSRARARGRKRAAPHTLPRRCDAAMMWGRVCSCCCSSKAAEDVVEDVVATAEIVVEEPSVLTTAAAMPLPASTAELPKMESAPSALTAAAAMPLPASTAELPKVESDAAPPPPQAAPRPARKAPTMHLHSRAATVAAPEARKNRWKLLQAVERVSSTIRISMRLSRASKVPAPPDAPPPLSDRWTSTDSATGDGDQ